MKNLCAATCLALLLLTSLAKAADIPNSQKIDDAMKQLIASHEIAGAVTVVADKDHILHESAVGLSNIEKNQAMKPDALFWIASMTKPVTATAIMMLQEEGKLSVNDPVAKYIPELAQLKDAGGKPVVVLLKHLLTHTSGMVGEAPTDVVSNAKSLADLMPAYAKAGVHFEPGSKWEYCQSGINSLGRVIEVVSGKSLPDFYAERIFKPLGMKDTTFYLTADQLPRLATSYAKKGDALAPATIGLLHGRSPTDHDRYPAANGGLFASAGDYARFAQMLLNEGTLDGHTLLKPESVREMRTIQTADIKTGFTPGNGWGWGVCVVRHPQGISAMLSPGTFGHGGAYGTQIWIDPVKNRVYLLMVQRSNFANSDDSPARLAFQKVAAETNSAVELKQESNHVSVRIDGKPFTDYWFGKRDDRAYARPFFFPVLAPDGVGVTADHYGQKEHPHHNSLWVGHGDVNGADHWALEGAKTPLQRHVKFESVGGDTIVEALDWEGKDHQPMMHEKRTMKFGTGDTTSRTIEFTSAFAPIDGPVTFGDTKEAGLVAVRMNDQIPKNHPTLTNSTGATGEKATWGKPADWCDISGTIDGKTYGVSMLDAPTNPLHPQQWHVREYGLMGANPFGLSYYDKKVAKHTGDFVLPAGKTTTFHYLVIIHEGDAKAANLDERYKAFAGK